MASRMIEIFLSIFLNLKFEKKLTIYLSLIFQFNRLLRIAPNYYDLDNFPPGDAKRQLEYIKAKMEAKQYQGF